MIFKRDLLTDADDREEARSHVVEYAGKMYRMLSSDKLVRGEWNSARGKVERRNAENDDFHWSAAPTLTFTPLLFRSDS